VTGRLRTHAELEATFRDVAAESYADPLEHQSDGLGWDPVAASAAIFARTSRAVRDNGEAYYLLPHSQQTAPSASGPRFATGTVTALRTEIAAALSLPAGEPLKGRVRDSRGVWSDLVGFELAEPLSFAAGMSGPVEVAVRASRVGEHGNVRAGTIVSLAADRPEYGLELVQLADLSGGRHGTLDAIGQERLLPRVRGEEDLDYAYRLSALPDVVSPKAIARICAQILSPYDIAFEVLETQEALLGFVLDDTPLDAGSLVVGDPWRGRLLLTNNASKRFFVVLVEAHDFGGGLPFDAEADDLINAFDAATTGADVVNPLYNRLLDTLHQAIEAARMAGVGWRLGLLERVPKVAALTPTEGAPWGQWTLDLSEDAVPGGLQQLAPDRSGNDRAMSAADAQALVPDLRPPPAQAVVQPALSTTSYGDPYGGPSALTGEFTFTCRAWWHPVAAYGRQTLIGADGYRIFYVEEDGSVGHTPYLGLDVPAPTLVFPAERWVWVSIRRAANGDLTFGIDNHFETVVSALPDPLYTRISAGLSLSFVGAYWQGYQSDLSVWAVSRSDADVLRNRATAMGL
jgi:hypothetical protein